jgi:uncharacterized protein YpbB
MVQLTSIILYCLKQLSKERTVYSIYHLLNGKKSSQTIQDAHLFSLKKFFGVLSPLSRDSYDSMIRTLQEQGYIINHGEQRFLLTSSGESFLNKHPILNELNGWEYHQITWSFWERLSLLIQVASNIVHQEKCYIPIQKNKDVHQWVKTVLKEMKVPKYDLGRMIYQELIACFEHNKTLDPSVLVFRLTGFQQIGLTPMQTAQKLSMNHFDYQLQFINIIHYMIRKIAEKPEQFPILSLLQQELRQQHELTQSSRKTWQLLIQGYSLEAIARLRKLRESTIEDHLVEIALYVNHFSIDPYVEQKLQEEILAVSRRIASRQLKLIKDQVNKASYFQIRLVLAKYGGS